MITKKKHCSHRLTYRFEGKNIVKKMNHYKLYIYHLKKYDIN
jgi:hypothetical protein